MNKKIILMFSLFICGCVPKLVVSQTNNSQVNTIKPSASISPMITQSANPMSSPSNPNPQVSQPGGVVSSPNINLPPAPVASTVPSNTTKINVLINYANSSLSSGTKTIKVILIDQANKTSTLTFPLNGGGITIPLNTRIIIFNAIDSNDKVISTVSKEVNFDNTNNSRLIEINFSNPTNNGSSSGGSSSGGSSGNTGNNPNIPVNATVRPDNTSVK